MRRPKVGYTLWPASFELTAPGPMLDEAEALGVDLVEIPLFTTRLIADGRINEPAMRWFERETAGRALGFSVHAMLSLNLMDDPARLPLHERVARANIELTGRLGAQNMVLHCGLAETDDPGVLEDAYSRQRECLARLGDHAARHGVTVCVENIWSFDRRATALPSRLARELQAVGHPHVRATLDFAHAALQCALIGATLMDEVRALAPLAPHLHLNDCFGREAAAAIALPAEAMAYGSGDLHLPLGWGSLDWDRLVSEPDWPEGALVLNEELHPAYWYALADDVAELRRLSDLLVRARAPAA